MRPLVVTLLLAFPAVAAPVPKALKAKATMDGVWEWVEFNGNDGKMQYAIKKPTYWRIEGDRISVSKPSLEEVRAAELKNTIRVRDEQQPHLRTYDTGIVGTTYSAVMELDGDTLRWCFAIDSKQTVTECKPAGGVYYYVFQRVKDK